MNPANILEEAILELNQDERAPWSYDPLLLSQRHAVIGPFRVHRKHPTYCGRRGGAVWLVSHYSLSRLCMRLNCEERYHMIAMQLGLDTSHDHVAFGKIRLPTSGALCQQSRKCWLR